MQFSTILLIVYLEFSAFVHPRDLGTVRIGLSKREAKAVLGVDLPPVGSEESVEVISKTLKKGKGKKNMNKVPDGSDEDAGGYGNTISVVNPGAAKLPFPSNPAAFFVEAIAAVGITAHAFYGVSAIPNITTADGKPFGNLSIPILGGFILNVGSGSSKKGSIQVQLRVKDALLLRPDTSILVESDESRDVKPSSLATMDQEKVQKKFKTFRNPVTAAKLADSYKSDRKKFYTEQLESFFPAELKIHFNVKAYTGAEDIVTKSNPLTNTEVITLEAKVPKFPAKEMGFVLKKAVRLIDKRRNTVLMINQMSMVLVHEPEEKYCRVTVASRLSQKTVTDLAFALKPKNSGNADGGGGIGNKFSGATKGTQHTKTTSSGSDASESDEVVPGSGFSKKVSTESVGTKNMKQISDDSDENESQETGIKFTDKFISGTGPSGVPGISSSDLGASNQPFPTNPATFFAEAIASVAGTAHAFYGVSVIPNVTKANGEPFGNLSVPILGGFIINVGAGSSNKGGIQVKFTVKDALLLKADTSLLLESDESRSVKHSVVATMDKQKVQTRFETFRNPLTMSTHADSFVKDQKNFYADELKTFFPAKIKIHFHVKAYLGTEDIVTKSNVLTNVEQITLEAEVPNFPTKEMGFVLKKVVKLVDKNNKQVLNINQMSMVLVHEPEEKYCRITVGARLSQKTVTDLAFSLKPENSGSMDGEGGFTSKFSAAKNTNKIPGDLESESDKSGIGNGENLSAASKGAKYTQKTVDSDENESQEAGLGFEDKFTSGTGPSGVPGISSLDLGATNQPFPTNPATFFAEAIASVAGTAHAFYGVSAIPNVTKANGEPFGNLSVPILGGFIINVGAGSSNKGGIQVKFTVKDALLLKADTSLLLESDESRTVKHSVVATMDKQKIQTRFETFRNPLTMSTHADSFVKDQKNFYADELKTFFPAKIKIHFHVKAYLGTEDIVTKSNALTNVEQITLEAEVPNFPTKEMGFVLKKVIKLVDKNNKIVLNINQMSMVLIHEPEEKYCRITVGARLSQKTVTDLAFALKP